MRLGACFIKPSGHNSNCGNKANPTNVDKNTVGFKFKAAKSGSLLALITVANEGMNGILFYMAIKFLLLTT